MNAWKAVCAAEAVAIGITWWLLGGQPHPAPVPVAPDEAIPAEQPALALLDPLRAPTTAVAVPEAKQPGHAPRDWSAPAGRITLLLTVTGPGGADVERFSYRWTAPDSQGRWIAAPPSTRHLALDDLLPGVVEVEVQAPGFVTLHAPITIQAEPPVQRHTLTLEQAWRVILWARTSTGTPLQTWLQEATALDPREYRLHALPVREAPLGHRAAKDRVPLQNSWGAFVPATSNASSLPKGCVGALDLIGEPPLLAAYWLDRIYLGAVPIAADGVEAVLVVDENALLEQFARVRFRCVDGASGQPLAGVEASLSHAWGDGGPRMVTDAAGHAVFHFVLPENLDLDLALPGYADGYREIQTEPGALLDLGDLPLHAAGTVHARVLDPGGAPANAARFQFFPTSGWTRPEEPRRYSSGTDASGRLEIRAGAARYQAIFGGRDGVGLQAVVWERGSAEPEERVIQLQAGAETRLLAVPPIGQARVLWLSNRDGYLLSRSHLADGGAWPLVLTPGDYLLRVEDLGRNHLTTLDLHVPDGGGDIRVTLP